MFLIVIKAVELVVLLWLGFSTLYLLYFSVAGLVPGRRQPLINNDRRKFAVFIPAYKEDAVIVSTAEEALKQDYPRDLFEVIVIADSLQDQTIGKLRTLDIKLVEVSFENSTKAKALQRAIDSLEPGYDIALILDADNVMEPLFLKKINESFDKGYKASQGHRVSKNQNTSMAVLDSVSEEINNHIFRQGHRNSGLSAALIGSGMAFDYTLFVDMMKSVTAVGGFDKDLEIIMAKREVLIEYVKDAFIQDEKVQKAATFTRQRRRWLSAQLVYFRANLWPALKSFFLKGRFSYLEKVIQMGLPPRIIQLGLTSLAAIIIVISGIIADRSIFSRRLSVLWLLLFAITSFSIMISVPRKYYNFKTLKALASLPAGFVMMMISLLRIKGANKKFIHTAHTINQ